MTGWVRLVARNSVVLLVARVVTAITSVLTVPVLFDRLGERVYGVWALLTGVVGVAALADMGLGSAQIREVASAVDGGDTRRARAVLAVGGAGGVGLGALAIGVTAVCWPGLARVLNLGAQADAARGAALLLLLGLLLDSFSMPWRAVLAGTQRYVSVGWITAGAAVVGAVLAVLAVGTGGGLFLVAAAAAVTSALRALLLVAVARGHFPALSPRLRDIRRSDVSAVLRYGTKVQVTSAATAINDETDRFVLSGFFGPATTAGFDAGARLANLLRLPPTLLLTSLFPVAAAFATGEDPDRMDRLYLETTRYLAAFAAVCAAALMVTADPLIRLWLGHPEPLAAATIIVLVPGYAVNVTSGAAAVVTRAEGIPGRETRYAVMAAALNLVLTVPLLRLLGPWGVPMSTTISAAVSTVYFFAHFHRRTGRPIAPLVRALSLPALAGLVAGAVTALLQGALPDGAGRAAAALAVLCRVGLTVGVGAVLLSALGFFRTAERTEGAVTR